jgi:diguanylate cyclase (GGDEF)-like protein
MDTTAAAAAQVPAAGELFSSPRQGPWAGFALAAEAAVQQLHERLGLDLWLVTHVVGDDQVVVASAGGWADMAAPGTPLTWQQSFCLPMVQRLGPTVATDVGSCSAYASRATGVWARVRAYVGVPLLGEDGALFGTLCALAGRPQPQTLPDSLGLVECIGQMLSTILAHEQTALARSQEAAAAYALAERDRLTGLLNRRGWDAALQQQDLRLRRYAASTSVLVLDIDNLRDVNHAKGHEAGDALVSTCSGVLRATSRPGDVLARLGGDEFAVLAIECDPRCARALRARVSIALRDAGVAASVGAATRRHGELLSETATRAEAAMAVDKRLRRHRQAARRPAAPVETDEPVKPEGAR